MDGTPGERATRSLGDGRLTLIVLPEQVENVEATLGAWLKRHLSQRRNTLRFLLPKKASSNIYFDRDLIVYARAVYLANQWKDTDAAFRPAAHDLSEFSSSPKT